MRFILKTLNTNKITQLPIEHISAAWVNYFFAGVSIIFLYSIGPWSPCK
jgi:hypothetical protein